MGTDEDADNGDELWVIEYEDGDGEDMNHGELMKSLLPKEEEECKIAGWAARESEGGIPPVGGIKNNNSPLRKNVSKHTHNKDIKESYTTTGEENFMEVCRRLELPKQHFKTYYESLNAELTAKFEYPFLKGKKKTAKLQGGVVFPNPEKTKKFREGRDTFYKLHELPTPIRLIKTAVANIEQAMEEERQKKKEGHPKVKHRFVGGRVMVYNVYMVERGGER